MATTAVIGSASRPAEYPPTTQRKLLAVTLTTDGSDGASAGDIPASVFGLAFIESASPAVKSDNSIIVVVAPAYAGTSLLGKAAATAAAADIPSGDYKLTLVGY